MMKNKHLAKAVQEQCFYKFYRQIQYKCEWNNIQFITADRYFPSSKLCSVCGNIKSDLKLSDRIYRCECGNVIDRDYQASLNLAEYGDILIAQIKQMLLIYTHTLVRNLSLWTVISNENSLYKIGQGETGMKH